MKVNNDFSTAIYNYSSTSIFAWVLYLVFTRFGYFTRKVGPFTFIKWTSTEYENQKKACHFMFKTRKSTYRWDIKFHKIQPFELEPLIDNRKK